ncbi:MAG: hypothetical protein ACR2LR_17105 [Hassallia sp.]
MLNLFYGVAARYEFVSRRGAETQRKKMPILGAIALNRQKRSLLY